MSAEYFYDLSCLLRFFLLSLHCALKLGHNAFWPHADRQALLQPALLTLAAHIHVDLAAIAILALVYGIPGDTASKEALAALARQSIVVITRRTIAAYKAQFFLLPWCGPFSFL